METIEYERMFRAEEVQWWYAGMRAIAAAVLGDAPGARFLDAGCGSGRNLVDLEPRGFAVGLDLAPEAVALCRGRGVRAVRGETGRLPFGDGCFDGVTSLDVLYHRWVRDDRAAVAELVRVMRPGGVLLVRVPALRWLWGAHDNAVHSRHRYTRAELVALLAGAGLELLRASYCNTLLLPLLAARRWLDRISGRRGSDVGLLPGPLETAFRGALELEARWLRRHDLPLGASAIALARKPLPASPSRAPGRQERAVTIRSGARA